MSSAQIGYGSVFQSDYGESPQWVTLAEITSFSFPPLSRDAIDAGHESLPGEWRDSLPGLKSGGEISLDMNFTPGTYQLLQAELGAQIPFNRRVVLGDGSTIEFDAFLIGLEGTIATGDKISSTARFKIIGEPGAMSPGVPVDPFTGTLVTFRELLQADRTYYVRPDGSDSNDGLTNTAGGAFLTGQRAGDVILNTIDLNGHDVTIQFADGTYDGFAMSYSPVGAGTVYIKGNAVTPSNVEIVGPSATRDGAITLEHATSAFVQDLKVSGSVDGLHFSGYSIVGISNIVFGACGQQQLDIDSFAYVYNGDNHTIVGNANRWCAITTGGFFQTYGGTVTLSGTPAFTEFIFVSQLGLYQNSGGAFSGSATGTRFVGSQNGVIYTGGGGPHFFPGDVEGFLLSGATYDDDLIGGVREKLTADRTYYVRSDGSDSNTGLVDSAGGAFLTGQKAWDVICSQIDLNLSLAIIKFGSGTFAQISDLTTTVVGGLVEIHGNGSGNTTLDFLIVTGANHALVQDITLTGILAAWDGIIEIGDDCKFGTSATEQIHASSGGQIRTLTSGYTISGDAPRHAYVANAGQFRIDTGCAVTVTGRTFSDAFVSGHDGGLFEHSGSFTGTFTGVRFKGDGLFYGSGLGNDLTAIPGSAAGTLEPGGRYNDVTSQLLTQVLASGSFPAAANLDVAIPAGIKTIQFTFDNLSFDTATRAPLIRFSLDGGSTYETAGYLTLSEGAAVNGDSSILSVPEIAAGVAWLTLSGEISIVYGLGTIWSRYIGLTDDFGTFIHYGNGRFNIDVTGTRATHLRILVNGSGNFDAGTYKIYGTG